MKSIEEVIELCESLGWLKLIKLTTEENEMGRMFNKKIESGEGGGKFVKLKDGDKFKGVIRGEIDQYYAAWNDEEKTYVECQESAHGAKLRFKCNFVVSENGAYTARILEQGPQMYKALQVIEEDYDLNKTMIFLKRKGSSETDTEYSASVAPGGDLTETDLTNLGGVELLEL